MFCFQSPFTRASRGIVPSVTSQSKATGTNSLTSGEQSSAMATMTTSPTKSGTSVPKTKRRSSTDSSSSIRYIDQERSISSSTDTLPDAKTDYLDTERLSPGPSGTLAGITVVLNGDHGVVDEERRQRVASTDHRSRRSSSSPRVSPIRKSSSCNNGANSWHKKLLLRLRSTDSSNSTSNSSNGDVFSSSATSSTLTSDSPATFPCKSYPDVEQHRSVAATMLTIASSPLVLVDSEDEQQQQQHQQQREQRSRRSRAPGTVSMNDISSLQNGFSDPEEEEEEGNEKTDGPEKDEAADEEKEDEYEEEDSSLPSSPAVATTDVDGVVGYVPSNVRLNGTAVSAKPYYDFLAVNGGSMRQDTTSTSSPQLSSGGSRRSSSDLPADANVGKVVDKERVKDALKPETLDVPSCLPAASSCPNLERQIVGGLSSPGGSSTPSPTPGPAGPRFKPLEEGDIQVCYLNHTKTLVKKILSSKFLRRWETHHLYLNDACLSSRTLTGFLQQPIPYSSMSEVRKYAVARWDPTYQNCLSIVLPDGSLLLQASNPYTRDQWYHSILWKKSIFKYQHLVSMSTREEVVLRELRIMVDFALCTPLQDERVAGAALEAVAKLLEESLAAEGDHPEDQQPDHHRDQADQHQDQVDKCRDQLEKHQYQQDHRRDQLDHRQDQLDSDQDHLDKHQDQLDKRRDQQIHRQVQLDQVDRRDRRDQRDQQRGRAEAVLAVAAPLLEKAAPPAALARALARLAQLHPRSPLVAALSPAITRCLKHTVDFSKSPDMRKLLQVFLAALYENNDGERTIRDYISSVHGPGSDCPHPRVLPNLVSICVAAIFHRFEVANLKMANEKDPLTPLPPLDCYLLVLRIASEYADWRPGLGALLHPVPFPKTALAVKTVQESVLLCVMRRLAKDPRCTVHRVLLPVREPQPGWIHIAAPSSPACPDRGELFGEMLTTLLGCCCRRKRFIASLMKQAGDDCTLLAVRGCDAAQEALCLMLEWRLLPNEEARLQVVNALESTKSGKTRYAALCQRQRNLQELQQKGGPRKLTLPVRATDADVALLLGGRALGNLECLSLAFTSVTSACAEQLIKLPALRYLDLWATQFGDAGLQMISEHLQKLQVLNLCETPVSDKGISTLASLTSLRKLNLNSTKLSAQTFESLKERLPALQEFDVRYTEAW